MCLRPTNRAALTSEGIRFMLSRRTSLRSAVAVLGIGAAIALSSPTPAFAANEGDHWFGTAHCTADHKIELHYVNGGWHDVVELNPTYVGGYCKFVLMDNQRVLWDSAGAGSGWWPDGPNHYICAFLVDTTTGDAVYASSDVCN